MAFGLGLVLLWTVAVVLLVMNPKNAANRWASALAFFAGCGVVAILLEFELSPYVRENFANGRQIAYFLVSLANFFDTFPFYWCPYSFLMFCICYSGTGGSLWKSKPNWPARVLLIPVVCMYLFAPEEMLLKPQASQPFFVLIVWAGMYFLTGDLFLVFSYLRAKNPRIKREKLLTGLVLIPVSLVAIHINYISEYIGYQYAWRYHAINIIVLFIVFIFFSIRFGFMGVKIKLEENRLEAEANDSDPAAIPAVSDRQLPGNSTGGETIKVFLVEDDPEWRKKITDTLSKQGMIVTGSVDDKGEALRLAGILEYDAIIMDLHRSGNPYDMVYTVAEICQNRTAKIIVLTSLDTEQAITDFFTAGAVSVVSKTEYQRIPHIIRAMYQQKTPLEVLLKEFSRLKEEEQLKVLTSAEMEIYRLMSQGYPQTQIAKILHKSEGTLKNQVTKILKKLDATSSKEAVKKVKMKGLLEKREEI